MGVLLSQDGVASICAWTAEVRLRTHQLTGNGTDWPRACSCVRTIKHRALLLPTPNAREHRLFRHKEKHRMSGLTATTRHASSKDKTRTATISLLPEDVRM